MENQRNISRRKLNAIENKPVFEIDEFIEILEKEKKKGGTHVIFDIDFEPMFEDVEILIYRYEKEN